jgi:hypothetical protein
MPIIRPVRWPVFNDTFAEGLLLQPDQGPVVPVVAIPEADWSPEMLVGLQIAQQSIGDHRCAAFHGGCMQLGYKMRHLCFIVPAMGAAAQ